MGQGKTYPSTNFNGNNNEKTPAANQKRSSQGKASTIFGIPTMGTPKNKSPTTVVNILRKVPNNHALIVTLQREMDTLKNNSAKEMENLWKENVILREQYQKLQEDH